jgi:hypothetical protein
MVVASTHPKAQHRLPCWYMPPHGCLAYLERLLSVPERSLNVFEVKKRSNAPGIPLRYPWNPKNTPYRQLVGIRCHLKRNLVPRWGLVAQPGHINTIKRKAPARRMVPSSLELVFTVKTVNVGSRFASDQLQLQLSDLCLSLCLCGVWVVALTRRPARTTFSATSRETPACSKVLWLLIVLKMIRN